ncbi:MAG: hypothetical protein DRO46_04475 [Candidatus Hecatellales archaeon]|nr:MAG: hypothetical protein DRO46_04475 [Candidatus Hecatellales archaeon]
MATVKVYLESFGCSANLADGERMLGCLEQAGFQAVSSLEEADIVIYNTCAVKGPTEDRMISLLRKVPKDKKVVVAGCLPLINMERLRREARFDGVVGPAASWELVKAVREVLEGGKPTILTLNSKPPLSCPVKPSNPVRRIIPVAYGCLGSCSYCCVRFARGRLRSYTPSEIVSQVRKAVEAGAKEIWITGQDLSCYGLDCGFNLPKLLEEIVEVKGDFKIRVGMMNPRLLLPILDEVAEAFTHPKIFKFAHIPVQSGDNHVLKLMNRGYGREDFKEIVKVFRGKIPELTLATDIICGFPGESEEAFRQTVKLLEETQPDIVNISKFYPRPGTPARRLGKLPTSVVKERSRKLSLLASKISLARNKRWLGWRGEILVDEEGFNGSMIGRNYAYKPIVLKETVKMGLNVEIEVVGAFPNHLEGYLTGTLKPSGCKNM